ncbi:hypothetical protein SteCoe_6903 [Stentor coeruleus]|uniref:Phosphatidic acid phosphatase type 2/haloperoxidase domain-containing protein n=1 Tax=Stentor coeruleus TaxID=5963 RepID=A0A1R2CNZ4_9CILI|nr:hypothetical protein SteCoe_6903 [Stentor coeruleus]
MAAEKIAIGLLIALIAAIEIALSFDIWLDSGSDYCEKLQESSNGFQDFLMWVTQHLTYLFAALMMLAIILEYNYLVGLELAFIYTIVNVIESLMKASIGYPRPYWIDSNVEGFSCSEGFGDPSGHSMMVVAIFPYAVYRTTNNYLYYVPVAIFDILVLHYRMYGGYHSYSQVVLGTLIGGYILYIAISYFNYLNFYIESTKKIWGFASVIAFCFIVMMAAVLLYAYREVYWEDEWSDNIEANCNRIDGEDAKVNTLFGTFTVFFWLGAVSAYWYSDYMRLKDNSIKIWERVLRILIVFGAYEGFYFLMAIDYGALSVKAFMNIVLSYLQGFLCCGGIPLLWAIGKGIKPSENSPQDPESAGMLNTEKD